MPNLTGQTLKNRYQVIESLGRGGMAEVYKVYDAMRAAHLAMKVLRQDIAQDPVFLRRFQREAKALADLQHPNIVRFFGLEREDLTAFLLMEYVEGVSLQAEILRSNGQPLPYARIVEILRPVCSALHYAHQQGIAHCDLKPGNILIEKGGRVLLTDFGIARTLDAATATMAGIGTPAYMAPELVKGEEPSPQTDIYALGVVLYEMLTGGERPFTGTTAEKVRWEQLNQAPTFPRVYNPGIPVVLENIVLRCLIKESETRYPSALILLEELKAGALKGAAMNQPSKATPAKPRPARSVSEPKRKPAAGEVRISPVDGMRMVYVPAGEFIMGSDKGEKNERPAHKVNLDAYWIDQTPVTNVMFTQFLNVMEEMNRVDPAWADLSSTIFHITKTNGGWQAQKNYEQHPVVMVNWFAAQAYCQWAGRRLPTEAEWEKAARGTDGRKYPWGNAEPNKGLMNFGGQIGGTTRVGSYPQGASPYGALDMAGNVWEWVADWYDKDYYNQSPGKNPPGPSTGQDRVMRGGSWYHYGRRFRVYFRTANRPEMGSGDLSFRCAASPH